MTIGESATTICSLVPYFATPATKTKHVVGFSGGIDSQATARWVLNRNNPDDVVLLNSDVGGHEHPITMDFIKWYSENVHPVVVVSPIVADLGSRGTKAGATKDRRDKYADSDPLTFDVLAEIKGLFPSRKMQFCTEHLKLAPAKRWQDTNIGTEFTTVRYCGVRRSESQKRKNARAWDWDDYFNCWMVQPIVDWSKQMAFDYVQAHGEQVNPLYTMGFGRVGCAPCINSGKEDIKQWALRFPEMIDKVDHWEQRTGLTFFRKRNEAGDLMFVRSVVDWAMTTRGGDQYDLLVLQDPLACESKYGLCE
jgi:3'-phosphoadenosine 5'-phosphosulfate sulfotransferase (PAPS reductase)/FAD synthetase